jgi:hypothetical protein
VNADRVSVWTTWHWRFLHLEINCFGPWRAQYQHDSLLKLYGGIDTSQFRVVTWYKNHRQTAILPNWDFGCPQCSIRVQFCQLSHLVLCTSGFSLCINGTKSVVSAPTYRIYSAEGCNDTRKVFYLADYHCSAGYNVPIRLQGHTIWLVLKVLLPGFTNQCLRSARKGHGFPNLQFPD